MNKTVNVGTASVSYRVDGKGPALVLISGTGGHLHSNWDHLMPHFTAHRHVLRADYGGSGKTEDHGNALHIAELAEQVLAAAKAEALGQFDLVGYSLGSCIAIYIAAHYPQYVRSLVLLAGFAYGGHTRLGLQSELWLQLIKHDPRTFAKTILLSGFSPSFINRLSPQDIESWVNAICGSNRWDGIARQIDLDRKLDVRQCLGRIQQRTLVIACKNDFIVPKEHAQELAKLIPGAHYIELQSGHLAPFECPDEFTRVTLAFIDA